MAGGERALQRTARGVSIPPNPGSMQIDEAKPPTIQVDMRRRIGPPEAHSGSSASGIDAALLRHGRSSPSGCRLRARAFEPGYSDRRDGAVWVASSFCIGSGPGAWA